MGVDTARGECSNPAAEGNAMESSDPKSLLVYSHFGLQFAISIVVFTGGGYWLDSTVGSLPAFTLVGAFLGFGFGFYMLYQEVFVRSDLTKRKPQPPESEE
ncbi:MAG: AtpZ/AtpI family protein [Planctomycetes bacterium]|nr:AtpZ/AtpI family protein [Planctomycetota bacterium]